ncbi:MFS transporter [bacterium]|nr:MFS transporter [bacterium]
MSENQEKSASSENDGSKPGKMALLLIFLTIFIDLVGFGLIIPALPTYAQELNASKSTIGYLIASYSVMQFLFMPFWGRLSDRVGRKKILLVSLTASFLGYLIWGFADSIWLLFFSRMVAGFGNANIAVAQAYISDVTSLEDRAKGMGLVGAAFGLGFVIGPAIGAGASAMGMGLAALGFIAAAFSFIDLILTAIYLPEPKVRSDAGKQRYGMGIGFYLNTLQAPELRVSLLIFLVSTFAFANMEATLVLLTNEQFKFDNMQNMLMFLYIGVLMVIVQGRLIHGLNKKFGERKLIFAGCSLVAVGLVLTPLTSNPIVLYLALGILALGSGINTPANQSMLSKLAPEESVGGVMGVGQSLSTMGRILGPAVGGFAFEHYGATSPYIIGAVTMVLAVVLSVLLPEVSQGGSAEQGNPAS